MFAGNWTAEAGSWEDLMYKAGASDKVLIFNDKNKELFNHPFGHRAIGVVYSPKYEHLGNYVPSGMSKRYDAFIYEIAENTRDFSREMNRLRTRDGSLAISIGRQLECYL